MNGVYWLASYPKSGNTWLRLMIEFCLGDAADADINAMDSIPVYGAGRASFDDYMGVAASDLTAAEVLSWRADVLRAEVRDGEAPRMLKTHDARVRLPGGGELIPSDVSLGAVHLVRDPRDVVLSLARHLDVDVDQAITFMADDRTLMGKSYRRLAPQLWQLWSGWSGHTQSWLAPADFPVLTVRYERMRANPGQVLAEVLAALRIPCSGQRIAAAVAATALDRLRAQEDRDGFREGAGTGRFFSTGLVGGWHGRLSAGQVRRIEADHATVMRRLGYLP